jgi:aminoglycoside phosphotransferase (APT) family kinase protein
MAERRRWRTWTTRLRVRTLGAVIDEREAAESVRHVCDPTRLSVVQRSDDHIVFDAGTAIVKCGTRDAFGIEAWACEQAQSLGVPAPEVISLDTTAPIPHLALTRTEGVALCDSRLDLEAASRGAYQAGEMLHRLHEQRLPGFGWIDREYFADTGEIRGKSTTWIAEIHCELDPALDELVAIGALTRAQAHLLDAEMEELLPAIGALRGGQLLHGDLARMHVFVEPKRGNLTGVIDWGDLQVGDPAWDLAIAKCHFASPSEGILRVHHSRYANLFPYLVDGYRAEPIVTERMTVLGDFYLAYRQAWVATLGPGEGGVPNPSLTMLLQRLTSSSPSPTQD